ncbi:hypothetical protein [Pseudolysinimonas yzui]|uniref:Uncharacterized protein n=1 Tax=Pseudolysinimonas yzui TaxID=2708254 RepID=A0A8J3GSH8_9MICO|nr:hypothetical protein [Pseudolysinimonas yzui]GHF22068.1 hypothetical protein GCM10011600_23980 [Pseudolysinimonas yzui]
MTSHGSGRFDAPGWRFAGAIVSWAMFAFFFLGLYQAAAVVIGLGGYCASGGPYVIETECPEAVIVFAPIGIFGMFAAAGVALFFARGFGVSLVAWAWPILFVGLGIQFILGAVGGVGIISNIVVGVMFIVMGLVPVWFVISSKALTPTLVGSVNVVGARFAYEGKARRYFGLTPTEAEEVTAPTPTDWAIALGLWVLSVALGSWLSVTAFNALATSA